MQMRIVTVAIGAVLGLGVFAAAQAPPFTMQADRHTVSMRLGAQGQDIPDSRETHLRGNVVMQVNGVVVRADRAVIKGSEVQLEGNVRLTLPMPK